MNNTEYSNIISISCERWTNLLVSKICNHVTKYLHDLFNVAIVKSKQEAKLDDASVWSNFQKYCLGVADITYDEVLKKVQELENDIKNIEKVINDVLKLNFAVMSITRKNNVSKVKIPKIQATAFIKRCFQECAAEVGIKNPIWFDSRITGANRLKNFQDMQKSLKNCIINVITLYLPIEAITATNKEVRRRSKSPKKDLEWISDEEIEESKPVKKSTTKSIQSSTKKSTEPKTNSTKSSVSKKNTKKQPATKSVGKKSITSVPITNLRQSVRGSTKRKSVPSIGKTTNTPVEENINEVSEALRQSKPISIPKRSSTSSKKSTKLVSSQNKIVDLHQSVKNPQVDVKISTPKPQSIQKSSTPVVAPTSLDNAPQIEQVLPDNGKMQLVLADQTLEDANKTEVTPTETKTISTPNGISQSTSGSRTPDTKSSTMEQYLQDSMKAAQEMIEKDSKNPDFEESFPDKESDDDKELLEEDEDDDKELLKEDEDDDKELLEDDDEEEEEEDDEEDDEDFIDDDEE